MIGVVPSAVYHWTYRGGIPADKQRALLDGAKAAGLDLQPEHFFSPPDANIDSPSMGVN